MTSIDLTDHNGTLMKVERTAGMLQFQIAKGGRFTAFYANATHVGKIFELVVDQFFPKSDSGEGSKNA